MVRLDILTKQSCVLLLVLCYFDDRKNENFRKNMQREKRMFRKLMLLTISFMGLFSASVFAVGLGEIKQSSGLNQPLKAEIPLLSSGDLAEYEVLATLASNNDFKKLGVDRVFFLNSIKFETTRNDSNQIVIKVSTFQPVKEPFLNFVVQLSWPNGQILREYTLLLDPPIFEDMTSTTIEKTKSEPPKQSSVRQSRQPQAESRTPRSNYEPQEYSTSGFSGSRYGPVKTTDTLWSISARARQDHSISIQQALVAIYRANPDAFADGNINNLLKGKVLNIPDAETMRNVPRRAALQDVVMQNRQWRSGGARKIVDRTGGNRSGGQSTSSGSRLSLAAESSEGDAQGYGSDEALTDTRNKLARSQEESATLQAENDALRARLAEILDKAENIQGDSVVEVEDAELAALAQQSQQDEQVEVQQDGLTDQELTEPSSTEQSLAENGDGGQDQSLTDSQVEESGDLQNELVEEKAETTETDAVADSQEQAPPAIFKPEKLDKGIVDQILDGGALLWGSLGGFAVIILMVVFWRMKKRMEEEEFQDDLVASAGAGSMDTTETFELPDVGDDMLVELDMDDEENAGENTDESFDPLGEADIYIAYGKHEQAENILLEAIEDNPVRADLKVKLMECYAESDSQDKFEALAQEVEEAVDSDEWKDQINGLRAQTWGSEGIESTEDDFDLPSTEDIFGEEGEDELDVDFGLDEIDSEEQDDFSGSDASPDDVELDNLETLDDIEGLDSSDGLDHLNLDPQDEIDDIGGLDDVNDSGDLMEISDEADDDFSVDIDDGELSLDADGSGDSEEISLDIDDDFGFDDDDDMDFDESLGDDGDEIATKLDLARAYVDMGDSDGAKEILREVIAEGSDEQKSEAQELLDKAN